MVNTFTDMIIRIKGKILKRVLRYPLDWYGIE